MGRGKVQLKRIEDNNSRQVTFTKRRNGLIKKAKELAVLCDVDLALLVFSAKGRLSEFSSGDSMKSIIERYQVRMEEEDAVRRTINQDENPTTELSDGPVLLEMVQRQLEEENMDKLSIAELIQLELQLDDMLRQTRQRKTQVMCEALTGFQEQEKQLRLENELMQVEIQMASALNEDEKEGCVPAEATPNSDMPPTHQPTLAFL